LIVALTKIAGSPTSGTLALSVMSGWPDFGPGERVACRARLREVRGTRNPGLPDPALALRAAGIDALAGVPETAAITRIAEPDGHGPRRIAFLARRALRAAIDRELTGNAAAFLKTAVLGDRRGIDDAVEEGFRVAGATHVLSVSGLHLAAVATLLFVLVRGGGDTHPRLPLYIDPRAVAPPAPLPGIAFFALVTGEAIATLRSALMLSIGMGAYLVGRRASPGPASRGRAGAAGREPAAAPRRALSSFRSRRWSASRWARAASGRAARRRPRRPAPARLAVALHRGDDRGRPARRRRWWRTTSARVAPLSPLGKPGPPYRSIELAVVPVGLAGAVRARSGGRSVRRRSRRQASPRRRRWRSRRASARTPRCGCAGRRTGWRPSR
jgi:competence protein ComEC